MQLLQEMKPDELHSLLEYSKRTSAFKFKKPEMTAVSKLLGLMLKDLKTVTSPFRGQRVRVRERLFPAPSTIEFIGNLTSSSFR